MTLLDRILRPFQERSAHEVAERQLSEAKRMLLQYQSQSEHAQQMCVYYDKMVRRLSAYLTGEAR